MLIIYVGGNPSEATSCLGRRSSPPLFEALRSAGAHITGSGWPAEIGPCAPPQRVRLVGPRSSQEVSALLLALATWPGERELVVEGTIPSRPYVDITLAVLRRFAAQVEVASGVDGLLFRLNGPLVAPSECFEVEPDASLAAVALAAGCP